MPVSTNTGNEVKVAVEVTNSGKMDGEEVVQAYVSDMESSVPVAIRSLAGFKKVFLKAGETKKVEIILKPESFSVIDKTYNRVIEPGKIIVSIGGKQPGADIPADGSVVQTEIELIGKVVLTD